MNHQDRVTRSHHIVGLLLLLATLAVFWQVLGHDFVNYDDDTYVTANPHVQSGITSQNIEWAFTTGYNANWHPLTWMSHMLDWQLYGDKPWGHHLTSLLFHLANVLLLFLLLSRMTGSMWKSGFVAALFAIHPLHVESVAWIAERKDVLSTFFFMLTLLAYLRYAKSPSMKSYTPVMLLFALGLMSKPMLVTLPLLLILLDHWPLRRLYSTGDKTSRVNWNVLWEKTPLLALTVASSVVTFIVQQGSGAVRTLDRYPFGVRVENALVAYVSYILKMLWPTDLAILYPHPGASIPIWQVLGAVVVLAGISVLIFRASRCHPYLGVGWLWYLVTLVPVIGLVQVGEQAMADRYTYIPLIGLFILMAWGIPEWIGSSTKKVDKAHARHRARKNQQPPNPIYRPLNLIAVVLLIALAINAGLQVGYWENSTSLFMHAVHVTKDNAIAENDLGAALIHHGDVVKAMDHFATAVSIKPDYADAQYNLAYALEKMENYQHAAEHYEESIRLSPNRADAHNQYGSVLDKLGRSQQAMQEYEEAIRINPNSALAHCNLGDSFASLGRSSDAISEYQTAIDIDPNMPEPYNNLGMVLSGQGQTEQAIGNYETAVRLRPDFAEAHNNLAIAYYNVRRYADAWTEVQAARRNGIDPHPRFIQALSQVMPEPQDSATL